MVTSCSVVRSIRVLTGPIAFLFLLLVFVGPKTNAQTTSYWNGGTGTWSASSGWSPSEVPNNSGSSTFSVNILAPSSAVSMDVLNVTIDNLTLASANSLTINAGNTLNLVSGTSNNYGAITNNGGLLNEFSGSSSQTFNNYGTISGAGGITSNSGPFNNYGTISGSNIITIGPGGAFTNYGTFSSSFNNVGSAANYGTFSTAGFSNESFFFNSGTLYNSGSILNFEDMTSAGTLINHGILDNELFFGNGGTIFNAPGASILSFDSIGQFLNTGTIINAGTISNGGGDEFGGGGIIDNLSGGRLTNGAAGFLSASILNNAGTVTNDGTSAIAVFSVGTLTNSGTITNEGDGAHFSAGTLFNSGMVRNMVGTTLTADTFINTGMVTNQGTLDSGSFTNSGRVKISDTGLFNISTNYNQFAGSTLVNGTLTANNGAIVNILAGSLSGSGTVNANVLMSGNMTAGTPGHPMTFNINGNYTQNATGIFTELIGSRGNGLLNISGTAALAPGASLNVQLVGGFDPKNGTSFTIMDYGSEKGIFTIADPYFDHGKQEWVLTSYGDDVILTAEASNSVHVPEPSSLLQLLVAGTLLLGIGWFAKRKQTPVAS